MKIIRIPQLNSDKFQNVLKRYREWQKKKTNFRTLSEMTNFPARRSKSSLEAKNPRRSRRVYSTAIYDGISEISEVPKVS